MKLYALSLGAGLLVAEVLARRRATPGARGDPAPTPPDAGTD